MQKRRKHASHAGETSGLYNIECPCAGNVWVEEKGTVLFLEAIKTLHAFISQKHSYRPSCHNGVQYEVMYT